MKNLPELYQKTKRSRGFATKFTSPSNRKQQFYDLVAGWSKSKLLTAMGVINGLVYSIASEAGGISRDTEGEICINKEKVQKLARAGCSCLRTTISGLSTYVQKHWKIATSRRPAIRSVRDDLQEIGLLKAKKMKFGGYDYDENGKAHNPWSVFLDIDFAGLLALYAYLEDVLLNYWGVSFEDLPQHKGALVKLLYKAVGKFMGNPYRRKLPEGVKGYDAYGCPIYRKPVNESQETEESWHNPISQDQIHNELNLSNDIKVCGDLILTGEILRLVGQ